MHVIYPWDPWRGLIGDFVCLTCAPEWEYSPHISIFGYMLLFCVDLVRDTMREGVLSEMAKLQDPELQQLAHLLPTSVLSSRADSIVSKYGHAFLRWKGLG